MDNLVSSTGIGQFSVVILSDRLLLEAKRTLATARNRYGGNRCFALTPWFRIRHAWRLIQVSEELGVLSAILNLSKKSFCPVDLWTGRVPVAARQLEQAPWPSARRSFCGTSFYRICLTLGLGLETVHFRRGNSLLGIACGFVDPLAGGGTFTSSQSGDAVSGSPFMMLHAVYESEQMISAYRTNEFSIWKVSAESMAS
jgi:hypothetical protein